MCSCDCVKHVSGNDTCNNHSSYVPSNIDTCCSEANECFQKEINLSRAAVSGGSWPCSLYYNQPANQNLSRSNYDLLPQGHLYVIDTIEFGCKGCLQSVSLYLNQTTKDAGNTSFTLAVWRPYLSDVNGSSVNVFVSIGSTMLTFNSQPRMWNNAYKADSTVKTTLCFEPGDRLGVTLPHNFEGKILVPRPSSDSVVYKQCLSVCSELNEVLFKDMAQTVPVPLIDFTVVPSGNVYFSVCTILKWLVLVNGCKTFIIVLYYIGYRHTCTQ